MSNSTNSNKQIMGPGLLVILGLFYSACGNGGQAPEPEEPSSTSMAAETKVPRQEQPSTKPEKTRTSIPKTTAPKPQKIFDFTENIVTAHLRSSGLLVDLGTPARHKYTLGDWKRGWRGDFLDNGTTYSYQSNNVAHVAFHAFADEVGEGTITIRAKAVGCSKVRVYLNGKYLGSILLSSKEFSHGTVKTSNEIVAGNNSLSLRCNTRKTAHDGKPAAMAVDYIRITSASTTRGPAASSYDSVIFPSTTGQKNGLLLNAGESLTYYLPIPANAELHTQSHARNENMESKLTVTISHKGQKSQLVDQVAVPANPVQSSVNLSPFEGEVARITFKVPVGEVVIDDAELVIAPQKKVAAPGNQAATNFVLVLIDTLRSDKLLAYNPNTRVRSPYLDLLSKESMVFERAMAPENWTKPSVASMLTGLYPATHKTKDDRAKLPRTARLASEHFKELGFTTAGFVANGYVSGKFGFQRGWDTWTNYVREGKPNRAKFVVDDAVDWLDKTPKDKPFFLYVHTIDPHVPYIPPKKYWSLYDSGPYNGPVQPRATAKLLEAVKTGRTKLNQRDKLRLEALYDGEISYHDDQLVKLHDKLAALGLLENTLIIVTSDHGEELFDHGLVGHGHSLYEELLHVPLIVRLPGSVQTEPSSRSNSEVSLIDIMPTACEILGVECPSNIEGRSLIPLLNGNDFDRYPAASFSDFLDGQRTVRMGRYKLIYRGASTTLFDLKNDPGETADLSDDVPLALTALRDALGTHLGRFVNSRTTSSSKKQLRHKAEKTNLDPETTRQLKALGYLGGE
jgi:choline-sulfatase